MLRRFTPHELGLTNPEVRPIRGGAIVLSSKRDGLLTLQEEIERNPETKEKFEAKISIKKTHRSPSSGWTAKSPTRN